MLEWMTVPTFPADRLVFDPDLPPSNPPIPRGQAQEHDTPPPPWPTTFHLSTDDFCFDSARDEEDFPRSVWARGNTTESTCQAAWEMILEGFLPSNHAVSFRKVATFSEIAKTTLSVESYTSAKRRYVRGTRTDPTHADLATSDVFSSGTSQSAHLALTSTTERARTRLVQSPRRPDLLIRGLTYNRGRRPDKHHRLTMTGEVKPWTGFDHVAAHIAFLAQAIKYAIISRDMFGNLHSILCVGMRLRRILAIRGTNDLLIDVRTEEEEDKDAPGSIVITLELDDIFRYGYIRPPPTQQEDAQRPHPLETLLPHPTSTQPAQPTSSTIHDAFDVPPSSLFYRLYPDTDPLSSQPYGIRSRRALMQFLTHMGQAHLDACRGYPPQANQDPTPNPTLDNPNPLLGLSGKWARVTNVTLERVGEVVCAIRSIWDTIPPRSSVGSQSGQTGDSGDRDGDEGADGSAEDGEDEGEENDEDGSEGPGEMGGDEGVGDGAGRFSMDTVRGSSTGRTRDGYTTGRSFGTDQLVPLTPTRYPQRGSSTAPSLTRTGSSPSQSITALIDPGSEDRIVTPTHTSSTRRDVVTLQTQPVHGPSDDAGTHSTDDDISVPAPRVSKVFDDIMRRKVEEEERRRVTLQRFGLVRPLQ